MTTAHTAAPEPLVGESYGRNNPITGAVSTFEVVRLRGPVEHRMVVCRRTDGVSVSFSLAAFQQQLTKQEG